MQPGLRRLLFAFFVLSGMSGLVYQIVWIRMALASFGVITPFASVVVSVFMLGLALGTWWGGHLAGRIADRRAVSAIVVYGAAEAAIGIGAFAVPPLFALGREILLPIGGMGSGTYLLASSVVIAVAMLPFCICMGATLPAMMAFIERHEETPSGSFSFLYLANVVGAMVGAIATAVVLIESLGFTGTLRVAAAFNLLIAAVSLVLGVRLGWRPRPPFALVPGAEAVASGAAEGGQAAAIGTALAGLVLFVTGFTSMAYEIVWLRAFTPVLGTLVYAFSGLLTVYLFATWLGSFFYRRARARASVLGVGTLFAALALAVMLPMLAAVPLWLLRAAKGVLWLLGPLAEGGERPAMVGLALLSILPFCALLGYLTPMLVDHLAQDRPERAGRAYAINITGSILGPLAAAYGLLPAFGGRVSMLLLALPFALLLVWQLWRRESGRMRVAHAVAAGLAALLLLDVGLRGRSYEEGSHIRNPVVRRDHTATVIAYGRGMNRMLLVNGYGMTVLTPLTKVMAHLPLASLDHPPESALVIAFGMGTTWRSLLTWGIEATAVELVPSVVDSFGYFHADAGTLVLSPRGEIVIDDGRRFLARTDRRFDLITVDPPPPVEAAGTSLLYAEEFLALVRERLAPGGILQHWFPDSENVEPGLRQAVVRTLVQGFPYVRIFQAPNRRGLHMLASDHPIEVPDAETFVRRMPPAARADLMEWAPDRVDIRTWIQRQILDREIDLATLLTEREGPTITDDRPYNEYFVLRRLLGADGP